MNRKTLTAAMAMALATAMSGNVTASAKGDNKAGAMTKQADGTYVVNTTTLAKDVKGYRGNTPLTIHIKRGKVVKVEALANQETPGFFDKVRQGLLDKWNGMKANKAATTTVDGVTGATYSSKAVKENVKRGVKYYLKNK